MKGLALALALGAVAAQVRAEPVSGYAFLDPATQQLQDDEFLNPGFFAVEQGRTAWETPEGPLGLSCAGCHGDASVSMRGVAARYPLVDAETGALTNLELRINAERETRMQVPPLDLGGEEMIAMTTFIAYQSRGMPMAVRTDGPAADHIARGEAFYRQRRGQLNLACTHCHDGLVGQKLRGDTISQGQVNGFPIYRLLWRDMGSRHRMFAWCNTALRAEPYALGSLEYLELEVYLAARGNGLPLEAPAVRR